MGDVMIRKSTIKDFEGRRRLSIDFFKDATSDPNFGDCAFLKRPSRSSTRKWFKTLLSDVRKGNAISLMAEADGKIVGHCYARRVEPGSELSHVGELGMFVTSGYRGRGIGGKLLDSVIKQSKGKFEMLRLGVLATNKVAKHLYKSRGFRRFGTEPRAVKRGARYINMEHYYLHL
jgi:ribosomal protein S18 acetylase RimI-like enzyme